MPGFGSDIQDWIRSLPLFTRFWLGGTLLFTILGRFSLLFHHWFVFNLDIPVPVTKYVFNLCLLLPCKIFISDSNSGDQSQPFFTSH